LVTGGFEDVGFLWDDLAIEELRSENAGWFALAEDLNATLTALAVSAMASVRTASWDPKAVAVRLFLRCCSNLQGIILLTERGMAAEARTLVRSLLEGSFGLAALVEKPAAYIQMLKDDYEASRKRKAAFLLSQGMVSLEAHRVGLQAAIDAAGKVDTISPKKVAEMGQLRRQYLTYQVLSDDAAHVSARAMNRHLKANADKSGWSYKWGPATAESNAATLHHAVLAGISVGVALTQMLGDTDGNAAVAELADRFQAMPPLRSNL
jgi:hypothetical protein